MVVLNGGRSFVRRPSIKRRERDARRVARMLPPKQSFVLLGYSADPAAELTIDGIVVATLAAVREVARDRPIDLVAISYGGMVACRLGAVDPALVRRLVLVASAHRFSPRGEAHVERQVALLERGDMAGFAQAFGGLFRRRTYNWLVTAMIRLSWRRVVDGMAAPAVIVRYLTAMARAPHANLAALSVPALILGGSANQF